MAIEQKRKRKYLTVLSGVNLHRQQWQKEGVSKPLYSQDTFNQDLERGGTDRSVDHKWSEANTGGLQSGDVVYSQSSQTASPVSDRHIGYVLSQNYLVLRPDKDLLDPNYLVFMINEEPWFRKELCSRFQGTALYRVSARDLESLEFPELPDLEIQKVIGQIYLDQKKLTALRKRVADNKEKLVLASLKGIGYEQ
ncbi:restriction endonuclease subunit S [uncultured Faecalibaculum sp.]|uniref:restriction endonuclease subunit S n=1 Tax=uncultured Faecalibaculum sp. TaxID=1729681 RepID=UPI00261EE332|nr:restriction endonuclease subunit S [uncultured Faecalibaculum sp.]